MWKIPAYLSGCIRQQRREALVATQNSSNEHVPGANDAALDKIFAALPIATYRAGEAILTAGSKTGRLLILKTGAVAILKGPIEIARVKEPGAVIGELSALLNQPHTADVMALEDSQFRVADAALLEKDPIAVLHVARILAQRLVAIDDGFVELKRQIQAGQSPGVLGRTLDKIEKTLAALSVDAPPLTPGWRNQP
jgi:CRP/FNR family transcriptional regulator, cyclic AMP receptor protein